jgi:cytochrome c1
MKISVSKFLRMAKAVAVCSILAAATIGTWLGTAGAADPKTEKSGAQLWADNCARCHNMRSRSELNHVQWKIIVHHMRGKGLYLTDAETKKIVEFLQSGN